MLNSPRTRLGGLLLAFLIVLIGCKSNGTGAVGIESVDGMQVEEPTADTGYVQQATTGGDAAGTLNLPKTSHDDHGAGQGEGEHGTEEDAHRDPESDEPATELAPEEPAIDEGHQGGVQRKA